MTISTKIKAKHNECKLGIIYSEIKYEKFNAALWDEINIEINRISKLELSDIKNIPQIKTSREAYRNFGKEPARYRLSAEALHRRIIKGKKLYQICNIVDLINFSSIKTGYSIGGYDFDKIQGDIIFDIGNANEKYIAIGRGELNIENLPVFRDEISAFGSPTSDSQRTMITDNTTKILLVIINFGNHNKFEDDIGMIKHLIDKFLYGKKTKTYFVNKYK